MPYPSQMNSYGMQQVLVSYPTTLLLYAFLQNAGINWTSVNYAEQKANGKQAVSEENDLQALLASVLVPLTFGTLAISMLKSILRTWRSYPNYGLSELWA